MSRTVIRQKRRADAEAVGARLRQTCHLRPEVGIVLGSGFQPVLKGMKLTCEIPYTAIPGFCRSNIAGHEGCLRAGICGSLPVVVLSGRTHYYEGLDMEAITFPIRVIAAMGVRKLLLTNAAGAINPQFRAGDLMIIADHINFMGANPLRGCAKRGSPFFLDCTAVYDPGLRRLLLKAARRIRARIHQGIYLAVSGPSYETPAEIRAFARLGADAVGMSTVPEAIVARDCGLTVAGLSCITNLAAGRQKRPLSHAEVLETGEHMRNATNQLLKNFLKLCEQDGGRRTNT